MMAPLSTDPIGLDKHDPAGMARWLRERSTAAHDFLALDSEAQQRQYLNRWQQNVLPHLAFRFEQAATMVEGLSRDLGAARTLLEEWMLADETFDMEAWVLRVRDMLEDSNPFNQSASTRRGES